MTPEERLDEIRRKKVIGILGLFAAKFGEAMLNYSGHIPDFKINGIPLDTVIKMNALEIREQLRIAVEEERYEHAIILRDRIRTLEKENDRNRGSK